MNSLFLFAKQLLKQNKNNFINGFKLNDSFLSSNRFGIRYLFTNEVLGIDGYLETRSRIETQFGQMREKFFDRVLDFTNSENKIVFTEDLKNVVFLAKDDEQELDLVTKAIKKFHSQNQSLSFGTFVFGPVVMRLLHHLSAHELAVQLFKDPELEGFFNQIKSLVILLNLLYINGKYEQILDVFDYTQKHSQFETKYPRDVVLLYISACYKINTEQSFDLALELLKNSREAGVMVTRKSVCLFASLALSQNQANTALEILSLVTQTNYISVRNLRLVALSELSRFDDLFINLKIVINRDVPPEVHREAILEETLNKIKAKVESTNDKQIITEFSQIERALIEGNHITSTSLDSLLTSTVKPRIDRQRDQRFGAQRNYRPFPVRRDFANYSPNRRDNHSIGGNND